MPEEAITEVLETVLNVKYIGPDAAPETEITDGFLIGFSLVSGETVDTYIEAEDIPTDQIQQTTIAGFDAQAYEDESLIGDDRLEHYVFQLDEGNANQPSVMVDVVVLVKGEDREEYRRVVQAIIESMEWTRLE
ncbi:MAG: hypothetical protein VKL39_16600 [Leptolyngbyaceae bacterium]|nr:hypothetical protein [Leptolyngbyaceae bacterium]